jgi:hypothetical protein
MHRVTAGGRREDVNPRTTSAPTDRGIRQCLRAARLRVQGLNTKVHEGRTANKCSLQRGGAVEEASHARHFRATGCAAALFPVLLGHDTNCAIGRATGMTAWYNWE